MKKSWFSVLIIVLACLLATACSQKKIASQKPEVQTQAPKAQGKPLVAKSNNDLDGDGVPNSIDLCPNSPQCAPVNNTGCWVISDIVFEFDKATVIPVQGYPILDAAVSIMRRNPELTIMLKGHTCSMGPDAYNQKLSIARAEAVRRYLEGQNVAPWRLSVQGFGESAPLVPNDTRANRARNRRVELKPSKM